MKPRPSMVATALLCLFLAHANSTTTNFSNVLDGAPPADTQEFPAEHDAYLQGNAGTRYNNNLIRVEHGNRVGYLQFDLSGVSGTITAAQLKVTVRSDSGHGNVDVYKGSHSNWEETNLSNANKPSFGPKLASFGGNHGGGLKTIDLNASHLEAGKLTIILQQLDGNDFALASSEYATAADRPKLVLTIDNSDGGSSGGGTSSDLYGSYELIDPVTDTKVRDLGSDNDLTVLEGSSMNLRAIPPVPTSDIGSVAFSFYDNDKDNTNVEHNAPYAMFHDQAGDYHVGDLEEGTTELTVSYYSGSHQGGTLLGRDTITLNVGSDGGGDGDGDGDGDGNGGGDNSSFVKRINCGSTTDASYGGDTYTGDESTSMTGISYVGELKKTFSLNTDAAIKSMRYTKNANREMTYTIDVPSTGDYQVKMHFAEPYWGVSSGTDGIGVRVFDVLAQGNLIKNDLDIIKEVGAHKVYTVSTTVTVTAGDNKKIRLEFDAEPDKNDPIVSAIEIMGGDDGDGDTDGLYGSYELINANTDNKVRDLGESNDLTVSEATDMNVNMVPPNNQTQSVGYVLTGPGNGRNSHENVAPYALFTDQGGDYKSGNLTEGTWTLKATYYSGANKGGNILGSDELTLKVNGGGTDKPVSKLVFVFDTAGNQMARRPEASTGKSAPGTKKQGALAAENTQETPEVPTEKVLSVEPINALAEEATLDNSIDIFPNPTRGRLTMEWEAQYNDMIRDIMVSDMANRQIRVDWQTGDREATVDLTGYAPGVYLVNFYLTDGTVVQKKVIKR
ncbi:MAG: malectin domain-containing carbohydrate-binding protein [Flavobacteriaceae bacterium]